MARFEALDKKVDTLTNAPAKANAPAKGKTTKATPEKWETVGVASETVEDARAFSQRVSVRVQKSNKGREQVHVYHQVAVPADRVRAETKELEKATVTDGDGKKVPAFWLNQRNPIILRGNADEAIKTFSALVKNASK
jgi:hypothetical protein